MSTASDQLRRMTGLTGDLTWSDTDLDDTITANGGDLRLAAASVYDILAAGYSKLVDVSESGSSRSMSQLYKNAQSMAAFYRGGTGVSPSSSSAAARVGQIERA